MKRHFVISVAISVALGLLTALLPRHIAETVALVLPIIAMLVGISVAVVVAIDERRSRAVRVDRRDELSQMLDTLRRGRDEYLCAMVEIRAREAELCALARRAGRHDEADLHDASVRAIDRYLAVAHGVAQGAGGEA